MSKSWVAGKLVIWKMGGDSENYFKRQLSYVSPNVRCMYILLTQQSCCSDFTYGY